MSAQSGSIRAGDDDWHRLGPRPHTLPRLVILEFRFWHKHGPRGKSPPKWLLFPCRFKLRLRSSEDLRLDCFARAFDLETAVPTLVPSLHHQPAKERNLSLNSGQATFLQLQVHHLLFR